MPFVTDTTEYSFDTNDAANRGDVAWVMETLTMNVSEETRKLCIDWLRKYGPKEGVTLRTPSVLTREGVNLFRKDLQKAVDQHNDHYPTGRAMAYEHLKLRVKPELKPMLLDLTSEQMLVPPTDYKTIIGQVKSHVFESLSQKQFEDLVEDSVTAMMEYRKQPTLPEYALILYLVTKNCWLPGELDPEQIEAAEYTKECRELQASRAGRKAKRLLLENLTDEQEDDYYRKGYFFVISPSEYYPNKQPRRYVIQRSFPNGNIMSIIRLKAKSGRVYDYPMQTFCFHPENPLSMDDILLAQKLHIENDESDFLAQANMTEAYRPLYPLKDNLRTF